jgi:hypothetical protein
VSTRGAQMIGEIALESRHSRRESIHFILFRSSPEHFAMPLAFPNTVTRFGYFHNVPGQPMMCLSFCRVDLSMGFTMPRIEAQTE